MNVIWQTLQSQSFIESFLLLLATALVTGYLVPRVKTRLDQDSFERQKRFEDELAKRSKIREDQARLLDEIETLLWDFVYLVGAPSYFVVRGNKAGYRRAIQQYEEKSSEILASFEAKISKLGRLAAPETQDVFKSLLVDEFIKVSGWLDELVDTGDFSDERWKKLHGLRYATLSKAVESALYLLAKDFGYIDQHRNSNKSASDKRW